MNLSTRIPCLTSKLGLLTVVSLLCGSCASRSEFSEEYTPSVGPHAENEGVSLHLISIHKSDDSLRARIVVENDATTSLELPASNNKPTWLSIEHGGAIWPATTINYQDPDDVGDKWPSHVPLTDSVTVLPDHSYTYFIGSAFSKDPADTPSNTALVLHGMLGKDGKDVTVRLQLPNAPDQPFSK